MHTKIRHPLNPCPALSIRASPKLHHMKYSNMASTRIYYNLAQIVNNQPISFYSDTSIKLDGLDILKT